jgi:hypothetical protein
MFARNSDKKFDVIYKEGVASGFKIIVDKETGVNYLYSWMDTAVE